MDYDKNGDIASFGEIIQPLFDKLKEDTFIKKVPPKSTGKEKYNKEYIMNLINELNLNKLKPDNIIRTLTEFTVWSIAENIRLFCSNSAKIIASGGGIHNNFLWKRLRNVLNQYELIKSNAYGLNPDAKEAICFAFLAFSTLNKIPTNLPNVTGAKKKTVLGVISIPD
jgi:anhydro-N-acetylmuramic acid kinase